MDVKLAKKTDIESIYNVMKVVESSLENKDIYYIDNIDFISDHIEKSGFTLISVINNLVIGFLIVRIPKIESDNLGLDINLPQDELSKVAHIESVAVIPSYRGGIQISLIKEAEKILINKGYRYLMCTVHPDNFHSLKNLNYLGYEIIKTKIKYGGYKRHILKKEFNFL